MNTSVGLELGYDLTAAPLKVFGFDCAARFGSFVFTSGQVPLYGDIAIKGKVGTDIDLDTARRAAEICAVNCVRAALAVASPEELVSVVKVFGMVNVGPGFNDTSSVINGATDFLNALFGSEQSHARSAVGMTLPADWAVEVEVVFGLRA